MPVQLPDILSDLIAGLIIAAATYAVIGLARWLARILGQEEMERWTRRLLSLAWPILASVFFLGSFLFAIVRPNPWPTVVVGAVLVVLVSMVMLIPWPWVRRLRGFVLAHPGQILTGIFFLTTVVLFLLDDWVHGPTVLPQDKIVFVVDLDDTEMMALRGIIDELEPKLGREVFMMNVDRSRYVARLDHMVASDDTKWDLIAVDINRLGLLVEKGLVEELAKYKSYEELVPPALLPTLRPLLKYDGKFYFAPFRPNVKIAYFNEKKFQQYDLQPPRTWDELLWVAKVFMAKEGVGRVAIQGHPGPASAVTMVEFIRAAGGDPFTLADQGALDALAYLQELEPYLAPEYAETRFNTANELLIDEVVYLVDNWTFGIKVVVEDAGKQEIKAYSGWQGPNGQSHALGGDVLAVPNGAPHGAKALELIELLLSKKTQSALIDGLRWPPARFDAYERLQPEIKPYFDAVSEALAYAESRPTAPQWLLIERCLDDAFDQLVKHARNLDSLVNHRTCLNEVPSIYIKYEVQPGDTLAAIAQRFETTQELLVIVNQMTSRAGLVPKQVLLIPAE